MSYNAFLENEDPPGPHLLVEDMSLLVERLAGDVMVKTQAKVRRPAGMSQMSRPMAVVSPVQRRALMARFPCR